MDVMREQKYVLPSGYHERSIIWRINSAVIGVGEGSGRLPYHDLKATGGSANLIDLALSGMVKAHPIPEYGTVTQIEYYACSIYVLLAELTGELIKDEPDMEIVTDVQTQLLQAYKVMRSTTSLLNQILTTDAYWDSEELRELSKVPLVERSKEALNNAAATARLLRLGDSGGNTESIPEGA